MRSNNSRAYNTCRNYTKCRDPEKTGVIFQAKDTRNKIANETEYDNAQLAGLQGELASNQLYSGIGIIPGTDNGGWSEGGENGTGGGNQGESKNQINTNSTSGEPEDPNIAPPIVEVIAGETTDKMNCYCSDITIQMRTEDLTQSIRYILTSSEEDITNTYNPGGVAREHDIKNGGTLALTRDGSYTITAYAYGASGGRSKSTVLWVKRDAESEDKVESDNLIVEVASGTIGRKAYYGTEIEVRLTAKDANQIGRITYTVKGKATKDGIIGEKSVVKESSYTLEEQEVANGGTFRITANGTWTILGHCYDKAGNKVEDMTGGLKITVDTEKPIANEAVASGEEGEVGYFRSDVEIQLLGGNDATSPLEGNMTYQVTGTAMTDGKIGEQEVKTGDTVDTGKVTIARTGTFNITSDGRWTIKTYVTDYAGLESEGRSINMTKDTVAPVVTEFKVVSSTETLVKTSVSATDTLSGIAKYMFYRGNSLIEEQESNMFDINVNSRGCYRGICYHC